MNDHLPELTPHLAPHGIPAGTPMSERRARNDRERGSPIDPTQLGPYTSADIPALPLYDYVHFMWRDSQAVLTLLIHRYAQTTWANDRGASIAEGLRATEPSPNRLNQFARTHDMLEGAEVVVGLIRRLTNARREYLAIGQAETRKKAACAPVEGLLSTIVDVFAARWLPGIQNIGRRLPTASHAEFEAAMNASVGRFLTAIDRLHTHYLRDGGIDHAARRWRDGCGVLDLAVLFVAGQFREGCLLAKDIPDRSDSVSKEIKANAAKAEALLASVYLECLRLTLGDIVPAIIGSDKVDDVVHFAQYFRGLSDEGEATFRSLLNWPNAV